MRKLVIECSEILKKYEPWESPDEEILGTTGTNTHGYRVQVSKVFWSEHRCMRVRLRLFCKDQFVRHFDISEWLARQVGEILGKLG